MVFLEENCSLSFMFVFLSQGFISWVGSSGFVGSVGLNLRRRCLELDAGEKAGINLGEVKSLSASGALENRGLGQKLKR